MDARYYFDCSKDYLTNIILPNTSRHQELAGWFFLTHLLGTSSVGGAVGLIFGAGRAMGTDASLLSAIASTALTGLAGAAIVGGFVLAREYTHCLPDGMKYVQNHLIPQRKMEYHFRNKAPLRSQDIKQRIIDNGHKILADFAAVKTELASPDNAQMLDTLLTQSEQAIQKIEKWSPATLGQQITALNKSSTWNTKVGTILIDSMDPTVETTGAIANRLLFSVLREAIDQAAQTEQTLTSGHPSVQTHRAIAKSYREGLTLAAHELRRHAFIATDATKPETLAIKARQQFFATLPRAQNT